MADHTEVQCYLHHMLDIELPVGTIGFHNHKQVDQEDRLDILENPEEDIVLDMQEEVELVEHLALRS